jgi:hypothetical protein
VIGETTSGEKAVATAKKLALTVALVSDQFPGSDAIELRGHHVPQLLTAVDNGGAGRSSRDRPITHWRWVVGSAIQLATS